MEAIAALGLVSNVIQLLDFTAKLVSQSAHFLQSSGDAIPENLAIGSLANENKAQIRQILSGTGSGIGPLTSGEAGLQSAAQNCGDRADHLLSFLKKLEVKTRIDGTRSIRSKLWIALKSNLKRDGVKARLGHLEQAQIQLNTALLQFIRSNQASGFEELRNQLKGVDDVLALLASKNEIGKIILQQQAERLEVSLDTLRENQKRNSQQLDHISLTLRTVLDRRKADKLLNNLRIPDLDARRDMIDEAADHTLDWFLEDEDEHRQENMMDSEDTDDDGYDSSSDSNDQDDSRSRSESHLSDEVYRNGIEHDNTLKHNARCSFQDWLSNGIGIFWLSGKAGSGKSTLIKFLHHHKRTRCLLEKWANDQPLIFASHFFWHSGSQMQKSHEGLLRSLLYQVLATNLHLIPLAFPDHWKRDDIPQIVRWTRRELSQALCNLCNLNIPICLFVDGLDEYHPQHDHDKLVMDIMEISKSGNTKLCVSSRPWQIFEDSFRSYPRIKLEDLNEGDIEQFLWNKLRRAATDPETRQSFQMRSKASLKLVKKITKKSSGVFLWAHLVANRLSDWLRIGQPLDALDNYVNEFPAELEGYLRNMIFERISSTWRGSSATAQALKLTMIGHSTRGEFAVPQRAVGHRPWGIRFDRTPLIFYWFFTAPAGLTKARFGEDSQVFDISIEDLKAKLRLARNFLRATCGDLLSISHDIEKLDSSCLDNWTAYGTVEFFHRSVFDFLMSEDMQKLIDENVPNHFGTESFHAQLQLAAAKLCLPYFEHGTRPCNIIKTSGRAFGRVIWRDSGFLASAIQIATEISDRKLAIACESVAVAYVERYVKQIGEDGFWLPECLANNARTLGLFFVSQHLHGFSEAKIRRGLTVELDELRSALGLSSIGTMFRAKGFALTDVDEKFVRLLLQNGVDSNDRCHLFGYDSRSLWHCFLGKWMQEACTYTLPSRLQDDATFRAFKSPFRHSRAASIRTWEVAKLLLEHGASISSTICVLGHICEPGGICHVAKVSDVLGLLVPLSHLSELTALLQTRAVSFELGLSCTIDSCEVYNSFDIEKSVFTALKKRKISSYLIHRDFDMAIHG